METGSKQKKKKERGKHQGNSNRAERDNIREGHQGMEQILNGGLHRHRSIRDGDIASQLRHNPDALQSAISSLRWFFQRHGAEVTLVSIIQDSS